MSQAPDPRVWISPFLEFERNATIIVSRDIHLRLGAIAAKMSADANSAVTYSDVVESLVSSYEESR